jgi:hypothetical protein
MALSKKVKAPKARGPVPRVRAIAVTIKPVKLVKKPKVRR